MLRLLISIFLFNFILVAAYGSGRPQIQLKSKIEVSDQAQLSLLDISAVGGGSFLLLQALQKIDLPMQEQFSPLELVKLYRQAFKIMPEGVMVQEPQLIIAGDIKIVRFNGLAKNHIERLLLNHLGAQCSDCDFSIQLNQLPKVSSPNYAFDFSNLNTKGSFMLPVKEENALSPLWITGRVQIKKPMPVASRLLRANERIQPGDVVLAPVDITWSKDSSSKESELMGQVLNKQINAGSPIWSSDIKKEHVVQRGQLIKVIIGGENSDFEISTNMTATDNGVVGDLVKVKDPVTKKELSGVVVDKGIVRIQ